MKTLILATKNKDKLKEVREIMKDIDINIISMEEAGITIDVVEDGKTFQENATKKAEEIMKVANLPVLADDSGLEIDYLNKEPGIYSARYLGENTSYKEKNKIILERLKDAKKEERIARFICAVALASPNNDTIVRTGIIEGLINDAPVGENGFGYDPIFYVEELGTTTANVDDKTKNRISHRAKALEQIKSVIISL